MSYTRLNSDFTTTKLHLTDDSATVTPPLGRLIDTYATFQIDCSLPELATFKVVVYEGKFTAAASKHGVTPSALSKLITRLEQALSVELFERTTRKLIITQAGQRCMTKAY